MSSTSVCKPFHPDGFIRREVAHFSVNVFGDRAAIFRAAFERAGSKINAAASLGQKFQPRRSYLRWESNRLQMSSSLIDSPGGFG